MTVSMRKMSAGKGYQYLLRSVVAGDGNRSLSTPLTRYYAEAGTPPGYWMGSGVGEFGHGEITVGSVVLEKQLQLLLGMGCDPLTGDQLGTPYRSFAKVGDRVADRTHSLNPHLTDEEPAAPVDEIEADEQSIGTRTAVAGFDFTFSVPKSVSVLWGVADAGTQALLVEAHHEAVAEVLAMLEREVAVTRAGAHGRAGAVLTKKIRGVAATAYDHWDSRLGDPQLHTHVVIANRVRTSDDGKWRTLDGQSLYRSVVALSEHYNAVLADILTRTCGLDWERRARGANRNLAFELTGVGEDLVAEFSSRSRAIEVEKDQLIEEYERNHGRPPSTATVIKLRAQATRVTRPPKQIHSLAELTGGWRARATRVLGEQTTSWARALLARGARTDSGRLARGLLRADDVSPVAVAEVARATVGAVSVKRSSWRHWNLWAEASRQTMEWRFATVEDRERAVGSIVEEAERLSIALTPPELAHSPGIFRRTDGTSLFRPRHSVTLTSEEILAAEDRLLARGEDRGAPTVVLDVIEEVSRREVLGHLLSEEQVATLATIAISGRQVDLLIGPAGAGKTTAMRGLHAAWTSVHGTDSVVGLAPSAAAADVLAQDLGVACDNTAKWLHEFDQGRATFRKGQLVIVDEATLAGTLTLDRLAALAADAGAKVLLVGDWAQLQSVDAGGAFALLAAARDDTPELTEVHRFSNDWEKLASIDLRNGRAKAISTYFRHDRVKDGTHHDMVDAAYLAWRADLRAGRSSVLVTESTDAMVELNERARAERILEGETRPSREAELRDGTRASVGDLVITRQNDRRIRPMRSGWIRNGDRWRVTDVLTDGSVVVQRLGKGVGASVVLPAPYVADHVDLGYAITAHRAQGITVETSHAVVTGSTTRENFYVAMTRGRDSNIAYVALDRPDDIHATPSPDEVTAKTILYGVLQHSGVELSAHQTIETEQEHWSSFAQLAAEYLTIAAEAQRDHWIAELRAAGLSEDQVDAITASDSFGALASDLRRAEANDHDIAKVLSRIVAQRSLDDADDIGAVLISRLRHTTSGSRRTKPRRNRLIAGLVPVADGAMADDMRRALAERQELMESRASEIGEAAVSQRVPWVKRLGEPPADLRLRDQWMAQVRIVAAYRDRYGVGGHAPVGADVRTDVEGLDAARARQAVRHAVGISAVASLGAAPPALEGQVLG
ncbi:conjugal transfer protein [Nocardioides pocheonensis]|uniref:Conjugal transfer protein n=1 Tax=Nocardioides pocheonensis TaxID=661485 RepID=A0A3N0GH96_9ACTN|nr:conjugal transfer protein [Nocardioides pocheonensis]